MRIGLDVDEVVADLHSAWLAAYNAGEGTNHSTDIFDRWEIDSILGDAVYQYLTPELYDAVQPLPGALDATACLRRLGHTLYYVSSCGKENEYAPRKLRWLRENGFLLPSEPNHRFIPGSDKSEAPVDILVDDYIGNVRAFRGWAVLLERRHNLHETWDGCWLRHIADLPGYLDGRHRDYCGEDLHQP